jgi:hypothetical protein
LNLHRRIVTITYNLYIYNTIRGGILHNPTQVAWSLCEVSISLSENVTDLDTCLLCW